MSIQEIVNITNAQILNEKAGTTKHVESAFSSDLMSDVLTLDTDKLILITGLNNLQTIRTAEMADIECILFARGKKPTQEMINLANKESMLLMVSDKSVFHLSGLLYQMGLKPVY